MPRVRARAGGQTIFVADAHRDDGKRFVARADEKLTAFVELELACRRLGFAPGLLQNELGHGNGGTVQ